MADMKKVYNDLIIIILYWKFLQFAKVFLFLEKVKKTLMVKKDDTHKKNFFLPLLVYIL